jgi:hypothetical protein
VGKSETPYHPPFIIAVPRNSQAATKRLSPSARPLPFPVFEHLSPVHLLFQSKAQASSSIISITNKSKVNVLCCTTYRRSHPHNFESIGLLSRRFVLQSVYALFCDLNLSALSLSFLSEGFNGSNQPIPPSRPPLLHNKK